MLILGLKCILYYYVYYNHRLIEIYRTFATMRIGKCGRTKRIKRDSLSFIIRVREMVLFGWYNT